MHRLHWLKVGIVLLLVMTTACKRSASTNIALTPLPSAPPPTATSALPTLTQTPVKATTTASSKPTEELSVTEPSPEGSDTATPKSKTQETADKPCVDAPTTHLRVGLFAYVNPDPPLPNNVRSDAGQNYDLIGDIPPGQAMKILDGPKCADGWVWWKIQTLENELEGWTAEGDQESYWLIPCASEKECGS